ncbi:hypothetical protein [Photobacterium sanguinicancri]|uniref:Transposase DDE domain-containing protein n=1 Tax=Photobacterium sanguinicancri TaxID=875932 RepID=A0AAW7Y108_9GAMM|nr:hypothetical protein [Photobacterium sanguinicancri]MDO6541755.1 hypothetical protein [Photobacterium sanguinicancri]
MKQTASCYQAFFSAEDRFLNPHIVPGFEPDVIVDFIQSGVTLAACYQSGTKNPNPLLQELFLRRVFFNLLKAIDHRGHSRIFRRVCWDYLHCPLLALKKYYGDSQAGKQRFLSLQREIRQVQHTSGF